MSTEAFGDTPDREPEYCPNCGSDFYMPGCTHCEEVKRRCEAEADLLRVRIALTRLWPALERAMAGLVFTADRAGEVQADMNTLREYGKPQEFECQGEPSLCDNPRGCACFQAGRTDRPSTPVGWSDTDWLKHLEEIRQDQETYHRGPLPETGWD